MALVKQEVTISFSSKMIGDKLDEKIEFETKATLHKKDEDTYLTFKEKLEGNQEIQSIWKWKQEEVLLMRSGEVDMRQVFRVGEWTEGSFKNPYLSMPTKVKTHKAILTWKGEYEGKMAVNYDLHMNESHIGLYNINITFKEAK